jgi:hypothetical protein
LCSIEVVKNVARNKWSFYIDITLWVYGKKVQVQALVDSGAMTTFIHHCIVEDNHLVTDKLASAIHVTNVDGTENKSGTI